MRRLLPLLLLLAGCGKGDPVADKIDLPLPPGTSIKHSSESVKEGDRRLELDCETDLHAKDIAAFYKSKGLKGADIVQEAETASIMGTTDSGQLIIITVSAGPENRQMKVVSIQPKDASR
ncbi:hypothetical protein BH11ARM2_BH11ARM2_11620 [soil metagenome]